MKLLTSDEGLTTVDLSPMHKVVEEYLEYASRLVDFKHCWFLKFWQLNMLRE